MKEKITPLFIFFLFTNFFINGFALAQSGRGRNAPPPPAPKPTPSPSQPVNVPTILNLPEGGKVVKQEVVNTTTRYVLKNGLTVIIRERHSTPLVAVTTYVKAGYFNEPDETAGLAHLMEHMFFKGTPTRPVGTIDTETARLGGQINASTAYDKTSYYAVAPAESLTQILAVQADMLLNPTFDAEELKKEALVVIQESKRKQDNPAAFALERMYATAFTTHRIKRWRIGSDEVLKNATREQLLAYYQTFYKPENTVLVIEGDVITNQIIGQVQMLYANFGTTPQPDLKADPANAKTEKKAPSKVEKPAVISKNKQPTPDPAPNPAPAAPVAAAGLGTYGPEEPPQEKVRYSNDRGDINQTIVTVGYRVPALTNTPEALQEQAALEVLAAVLGRGRGARLNQVLREKNPISSQITTEYLPLPTLGVLSVQMTVASDRIDRAEGEYFREVERLRREILSPGELQRAKAMLEKDFYDAVAPLQNESEALARYQAQFGDFRLLDSHIERIRAVTPKELQQVAAKYLATTNATVHEYEPRNAPPRTFVPEKFAEAIAILAPNSVQPIKPEDVKPAVALKQFPPGKERNLGIDGEKVAFIPLPLPVKDFSVYRGARAFVREDKSLPLVSAGIFFQGGRLVEDQNTSGLTELMLRSMLQSTMTRKADLIALELESYGAEIKIVNEPDFFGFTLDVLSQNAEKALNVLVEIIENPYFDAKEIPREKDILLAQQLQQRDNGVQRPIELALASIYPGHPYGFPRYGLPAPIKTATDEVLEAWHKKTIKRQLPLVMLVGDTDGSSLVASVFAESFKRNISELDQNLKVNLPGLSAAPQDQVEQRNRKQTAQAIAIRGGAATQTNPYALSIVQNYASGMGGRLFSELRDKQSLAYTVTLLHQERLASSSLVAYIATAPENEARAQAGLLKELENLVKTPPSDEEFTRGQNAAIGKYAVALQSHSYRALEYTKAVIFGRKAIDVENQPEFIRNVKKEDLKPVVEAMLKMVAAGRGVVRGETAAAK